jgi:hypothetical protein
VVLTGALVTHLKSFKVFLGFDWLQVVNPIVNWWQMEVSVPERSVPLPMCRVKDEDPTTWYWFLFPKVFSEEAFNALLPWIPCDHAINLVDRTHLLKRWYYPLAHGERQALQDFLKVNVETGKICPSNSQYASPFFFRPKPGTSKLRGIQDYRRLNKGTVKDRYLLPLISEVIVRTTNSRCFSKMDLW